LAYEIYLFFLEFIMANNKVPGALAITTFFSGDKINPQPLDAYGATGNGIYNKIADFATSLGIDPSGLLRGSQWVKSNLPLIKSLYKTGKAVVNGGNLTTRIAAGTKLFQDGFPLIAGTLPDSVAKTISETFDEHKDTIAKLGNVAQRVQGVDLHDLNSVGNLLGNLTGAGGPFEVEDKASIVGVMSGLAIEGCKNGIPGAITSVLNSTQTRDTLQSCLKTIMPDVVKLGNVDFLKEIGDFCQSHDFSLANLGGYEKFLKEFQRGVIPSDKIAGLYEKYLGTAKDIDPGYGIMEMNGETITQVEAAPQLSPDALQCLIRDIKQKNINNNQVAAAVNKPMKVSKGFLGTITKITDRQLFVSVDETGRTQSKKVSAL
jgi:hypothetical protein